MAEAKVMPFTSVFAEREILAVKEWPKVAVSADPLGTVAGDQSFGSFQLLVGGEESQLALPAKALLPAEITTRSSAAPGRRSCDHERCTMHKISLYGFVFINVVRLNFVAGVSE